MARNYNKRTEKDYGVLRKIFYKLFVLFVVIPASKLLYNVKIEGRENVPNATRLIIAPNHVSYLDPPFATYAVNKFVAYMAKKELFEDKNKLLRNIVHLLGGFAVNREKPELATFKTVKAIFNTPWCLGIFPQGRIVKDPIIGYITKGFILFAKRFEADIVPVAICGFDGYSHGLFEKNMTLKVGHTISYKLDEDEIVSEWRKQICEMTGLENKLYSDIDENLNNSTEEVAKL